MGGRGGAAGGNRNPDDEHSTHETTTRLVPQGLRTSPGGNLSGVELPADERPWDVRLETCRIELWRGYVSAGFVAKNADGVVAESSTFKWRTARPPDSEEARLAFYELVGLLKSAGWTASGDGAEWYDATFARPVMVVEEPEPVEAPEPEPEPTPSPPPRVPAAPVPAATAVRAPRSHLDAWRLTAFVALPVAVALLAWAALHG
jgi:hypothetical protein